MPQVRSADTYECTGGDCDWSGEWAEYVVDGRPHRRCPECGSAATFAAQAAGEDGG